ncbi:MAG: ABC transporter family substrate-binding protein [Actinobacteria bacterium]|nr:ABC transporter family substrate-binding protein [Actinomycetota bacterium]
MRRPRRRSSLLALILALALTASACAGGGGRSTVPDGDAGIAPSAADNDINATERDQLQEGGVLRWPLSELPPNFNTHSLDGALGDNAAVMGALLLSPFDFDAAAQPHLNEDFVQSAELTATEPQQVVTYRINPDAMWHDGTPVTVADFEAQWRALNGTDPAFKVVSTQGYDKIENVVPGSDEREVVVTFTEDYVDWRELFSALYPAATNRDPATFNDGWRDGPLTTAGPFKFESLDRTAQTITLVRNERWWGSPAKLDRLIYRVIDPDAQIDALANGEIDFIDVGSDVNKLERARTTPGIELRRAAGPNFTHVTLNGTSEVLSDLEVRRALALAIDRETIARAFLGPLDVPVESLDNHIFMRNQRGYRDNTGDLGTYAPDRAESMLDAAGWEHAGAVRAKNGRELAIRFVIPSQVATSGQLAELVQGMLQRVGVRVDIEAVPVGDFFERYITPGNFDMTTFAWLGTVFPISSSRSIYAQPAVGENGELDVQQNYARAGSDQIDRLFAEATSEFDEERAIELGNRIDALIWQVVHSLTLYQRPEIAATRADLANFGAFGFASGVYEDIGFALR